MRYTAGVAILTLMAVYDAKPASAQMCYVRGAPPGTVAACGSAPGYYRPQGVTLSGGFPPRVATTSAYYAPIQGQPQYWRQYYPSSGQYGPREPNPFNSAGRLSPVGVPRHLFYTRVMPRYSGYRYR